MGPLIPTSDAGSGLGTPPPQQQQTPPQPQTQQQAVAPVPQTQSPDMSGTQIAQQPVPTVPVNHALIRNATAGAGWHALMGTHGEIGPNGTVTQQQNSPGQLFRSILAGAIMGAASGYPRQGEQGGFGPAFARGMGAQQEGAQRQAQQLQQQSQQQFENQMAQKREQREEQAAATEDQLRKAQISLSNIQKLREVTALQGSNYTAHKQLVDDSKSTVDAFKESGLKPVAEDISEDNMHQYIQNNPGSSTLKWEPTGMKQYVTPEGVVDYQTTWSAYDPKGNIVVPQSKIDDWKASGLLDMHPDLLSNMKKDPNGQYLLPFSAFDSLNTQNTNLLATKRQKDADDFTVKKNKAELEHLAAQTAQERASAANSGNEAALRAFDLKQTKLAQDAENSLTKNGGDWSKLTPEQKVALQPQVQKDIDTARQELSDPLLKEQLQSSDPATAAAAQTRAAQYHQQLDDARSHSIFVPQIQTTGDPIVQEAINRAKTSKATPEQVEDALKNPNFTDAQRAEIRKALGIPEPSGANPNDKLTIQNPDGTVQTTTRKMVDEYQKNTPGAPPPKILKVVPAPPPQTQMQRAVSGMAAIPTPVI